MINLLKKMFSDPLVDIPRERKPLSFAQSFGCLPSFDSSESESEEEIVTRPLPHTLSSSSSSSDSSYYPSEGDDDSDKSDESAQSSEVEYDEYTYTIPPKSFSGPLNKINLACDLKKYLISFKDEKFQKKWFLYYALQTIDEIGFYPSGMPFTKTELLENVCKYEYSLRKEGYPISQYHKLVDDVSSVKFELTAKTDCILDSIYCQEQDEYGETLLHHAVRWNNYKLVTTLLNLGFNPNEPDFNGKTPIFSTIGHLHKDLSMIELLLQYGTNPYHKLKDGKTLLDKTVNKGNLVLVKFLMSKYGMDLGNRKDVKKLLSTIEK